MVWIDVFFLSSSFGGKRKFPISTTLSLSFDFLSCFVELANVHGMYRQRNDINFESERESIKWNGICFGMTPSLARSYLENNNQRKMAEKKKLFRNCSRFFSTNAMLQIISCVLQFLFFSRIESNWKPHACNILKIKTNFFLSRFVVAIKSRNLNELSRCITHILYSMLFEFSLSLHIYIFETYIHI